MTETKGAQFNFKAYIKNFVKNKAVIWGIVLTIIYLASGFYKWIEIGVPIVAFFAFVFLPLQSGFCLFIYLHCFALSKIGWYSCLLATVICYAVVILIKYLIGLKQKKYPFYKALAITLGVFLLVSSGISVFHLPVYLSALPYLSYLPLFYCMFAMRKEFDIHQGIKSLFLGLIVSCVLSLAFGFLPHFQYYPFDGKRFKSFNNCPNYFYMRVFVVLTYFMYLNLNKRINFFKFGGIYLVCALMIVATMSKTAICLLAFFTLLYLVIFVAQDFKKRYIYALVFLAILIVGIAVGYKFILEIFDRFKDKNGNFTFNSITTGRTEIWKVYLKSWVQNPFMFLFGSGMFGMAPYVPKMGRVWDSHNFVIMIAYRFGLIGIFAIGFIIYLFVKATNKKCPKFIAFIPLVWFLLESLADNTFKVINIFLLVLVCMILYCDTPEKQNKEISQNQTDGKAVVDSIQVDIDNSEK